MSFCTAINCIDGRVQLPVIQFCRERFGVMCVDSITEPGPAFILAERTDPATITSIKRRMDVSIEEHGSTAMVVVAHADCAGHPVDDEQKVVHLREAVGYLQAHYPDIETVGVWLGLDWIVEEVV